MNEYTYIVLKDGKRLGRIEFGERNSVPNPKEIEEAVKECFPNGCTTELLMPIEICINQ